MKKRVNFSYLAALLISLAAALIIGALILLLSGYDPLKAYAAMLSGAFSNGRHSGDPLEYAMVLCLCGLACDIGSRVGIFNVGGEGQLLFGAIFSAQIGVWMTGLPPVVVIHVAALGAALVGGFYAWIPGVLKVKLKVNEVITTIMLNTIAASICQFLAKGPWKNPNNNIVAGTANLPNRFWLGKLVQGSNLSTAIFAVIMTVLTWYIMQKTSVGYEMKLTGHNPRFALFAGLMLGAFPSVTDQVKGERITPVRVLLFIAGLAIPVAMTLVSLFLTEGARSLEGLTVWHFLLFALLGALVALTQIVPGLSATALLMMFGYFTPLMESVSLSYWQSNPLVFLVYVCFGVGFLAGLFLLSKVMAALMKGLRAPTFFTVAGLSLGSIATMFFNPEITAVYSSWAAGASMLPDLIPGIVLFIVGVIVSYMFVRFERKKA